MLLNSPLAADGQVAHRCLFVEIAITTFALEEPSLGPESFQLSGGPSGEDPEDEQPARFRRHRAVVEDGQMTENIPLAVQEGDAHVAVDAQTDQRRRVREVLPTHPWGDGRIPRARRRRREWLQDRIPCCPRSDRAPKGERAHARIHVGELGDDRVGDVDGRSQSAHQRAEEFLSRAAGRPFDDVTECAEVVANPRHVGTLPIGGPQSGFVHLCKQPSCCHSF